MATMPVITDEMVEQFRRTGRSRSTARKSFRAGGFAAKVVPQVASCLGHHDCRVPCSTYPDGTSLYSLGKECVANTPQC